MSATATLEGSEPLGTAGAAQGEVYTPLPNGSHDGMVDAHAVQTIGRSAQELYALWHDVERIPLWQEHVVSVTRTGEKTSHWVLGNPENPEAKKLEFDSELFEDVPGQRIGWRSTTENVTQSGQVRFEPAPSGRGTLVTLVQTVKVPGGELGNKVAGVIARSPRQTVIENLRHFKQLAETGEIPSVKGSRTVRAV